MNLDTYYNRKKIAENICNKYNVSFEAVSGNKRDRLLVTVRKEISQELLKAGLTLQMIGNLLGRHHSTIINYKHG